MTGVDMGALLAVFIEESAEHLSSIEESLLALERSPDDASLIGSTFRAAHSIKGGCGIFGFADAQRLTHAMENLLAKLRDGSLRSSTEIIATLLASKDVLERTLATERSREPAPSDLDETIAALQSLMPHEERAARVSDATAAMLAEGFGIFDDEPATPAANAESAENPMSGASPTALPAKPEDPADEAPMTISPARAGESIAVGPSDARPTKANAPAPTVRVDTDKIDRMINLVGELIIAHSMIAASVDDPSKDAAHRLRNGIATLGRNMRELQDRVLSVRMVPVGTVFNRFPRLVRDTAQRLGKKVELTIEGAATEIDKSMVEKIVDPLTHLVRNALDHGAEAPEDRLAAGKPEQAHIAISAFHHGGNVVIEVRDDGRGLDTERIRQKAIKMGLLPLDARPSVEDLHALIFAPGLSTASQVSDISGRGVGMDVVKSNVESLNGTIVFSSTPGQGSCVRVRLPLTMAILDGLTVRVGERMFVLPLASVVESFRPRADQLRTVLGKGEVVRSRGLTIPLVRPEWVLDAESEQRDAARAVVCILDAGQSQVALLVDELVGQCQAVVRPLERNYRKVDGVTGATVLGNGTVALILDIAAIARKAVGRSHAFSAGASEPPIAEPQRGLDARHALEGAAQ
jgi:two-component system chemotaxis sensor kinase CheA